MKIPLKKPIKLLVAAASLYIFTLTSPAEPLAGAWVNDEGQSILTVSPMYAAPYKSFSAAQAEDDAGNISDYTIHSKTSYVGFETLYEYGITPNITLIGEIQPYYYNDKITVTSSFNGGPTQTFSAKARYYDIDSNFGFKEKIVDNEDTHEVLSYQVLFYPGNFIIRDKVDYLSKKLAGKFSILYGYSFNIPFGTDDRPEYENYIDLEFGYKGYPSPKKHEGIVNASLGLKPFGENPLIVVGLYNTFNEYNFTKRPFDQTSITNGINGLGVTPDIASQIQSDLNTNLSEQANAPYHQLNFQLGFKLDNSATLYLQSFHNVIRNKPFTFNSYYLSFEYKF